MSNPVGLALELYERAVVHDAVNHGGGHPVVAEDLPPAAELKVGRDHHRLPLVGVGEDLEQQPGAVGVQRQEPQLVDDQQPGPDDLRGLCPSECAMPPRPPEQGGHGGTR